MKHDEAYSNLKRIRQILNIFIKHGFGQIIETVNLNKFMSIGKRIFKIEKKKLPPEEERLSPAERLTLAFEELGPTFVKFGQIMSTRPDLLPADYIESFKRLQDSVRPFPYIEVKKIIEKELENPIEDIFKYFEKEPVAAASIAQVHFAVLKSGEEVVVKVQRPGIEKKILADLRILYIIANFLDKRMGEERIFEPLLLLGEFDRSIRREMDFIVEAGNSEKLHENFADNPDVHFAKVYWDYTTSKVLAIERFYGFRLDDEENMKKYHIDKSKIARKLIFAYLKQFFEDGFFHADPHMGNILISEDSKILMLDCGMVGMLNKELKENFAQVFIGIVTNDIDRIIEAYMTLGLISLPDDYISFKRDFVHVIGKHLDIPIQQFKISSVFMDTLAYSRKYRIKINVDFLLLMRSLALMEDICKTIDPELNIVKTTQPYAFELIKKKINLKTFSDSMLKTIFDVGETSRNMPKQIRHILNSVQAGKLKFEFENLSEKKTNEHIHRVGNKVALSIVIAGLAIGSSIIIQNAETPTLFGFPFFGIIGYMIAGCISLFLIISILRSGKW